MSILRWVICASIQYLALIANCKLHIIKSQFNNSILLNYRTANALIKIQKQIKGASTLMTDNLIQYFCRSYTQEFTPAIRYSQ